MIAPRPSPRLRNTPRVWTVVIVSAVLFHIIFIFLFKPQYLEIFRTETPPGDEGDPRFPYLDNPFRVMSVAVEPRSYRRHVVESAESEEPSAETSDELVIGEPQTEMLPLGGGGGVRHGRPGPRNATVEPKPLFIPWPKYPRGIKEIPQGSVELRLLVNERGDVMEVEVTRTLPAAELNRIAAEAARKIRFIPGTQNGIRTSMWVRLAIGFQPR